MQSKTAGQPFVGFPRRQFFSNQSLLGTAVPHLHCLDDDDIRRLVMLNSGPLKPSCHAAASENSPLFLLCHIHSVFLELQYFFGSIYADSPCNQPQLDRVLASCSNNLHFALTPALPLIHHRCQLASELDAMLLTRGWIRVAATTAALLSGSALAQTWSACNPLSGCKSP